MTNEYLSGTIYLIKKLMINLNNNSHSYCDIDEAEVEKPHRWDKFSKVDYTIEHNLAYTKSYNQYYQIRYCKDCGIAERRIISGGGE